MALSTMLDVVNDTQAQLNLPLSSAVIGATDGTTRQLLSLLNRGGRGLVNAHEWGRLITLTTLTLVSSQSDYNLPADYDRMVDQTQWDRSTLLRVNGPITPQRERYIIERNISQSTIFRHFRQVGNKLITITPVPASAGAVISYEYVSNKWALSSGGTAQSMFLADTDTFIFDPDLLVADLKWRFLSAKGLDATAARDERDEQLALKIAGDMGGAVLSLGSRSMVDGGGDVIAQQPAVILGGG